MKPRDLYGVFVRVVGSLFIGYGILEFLDALVGLGGFPINPAYTAARLATGACVWTVTGLIMLGTANGIVRLVYGPDRPD